MPPLWDASGRTTGNRTGPCWVGMCPMPRIQSRSIRRIASLPAAGCRSVGPDTPRRLSPCTPDCGCCTADTTAQCSRASCLPRFGRGDQRPASPASSAFQEASSRACRSDGKGVRPGRSAPTEALDVRECMATCERADDQGRTASGISQAFPCAVQRKRRSGSSTSLLATVGDGIPRHRMRRSKAVQTPLNNTKSGVV